MLLKKIIYPVIALLIALLLNEQAQAFTSGHWWSGLGYYSENVINEVANKNDGSKGFLGTADNFPLIFKYDWAMTPNWFLAPQLNYTPIPRETKGGGAKVTIMHLNFKFGQNFSSSFDWSLGPGILRETLKGNGGTTVLENGTSTATFSNPGREVTFQKISLDFGGGFTTGRYHWGLDLFFLSPFSSKERTQNLMFSVTYDLSGSNGGSSSSTRAGSGGMFNWTK